MSLLLSKQRPSTFRGSVSVSWGLKLASIGRKHMKSLYALCFITLLAVLVDVVLFHSRTANAQNTGNYKTVQVNDKLGGRSFQLERTVVGFSCVDSQGQYWCYAVIKQ